MEAKLRELGQEHLLEGISDEQKAALLSQVSLYLSKLPSREGVGMRSVQATLTRGCAFCMGACRRVAPAQMLLLGFVL